MTDARLQHLIERAARSRGIPEEFRSEIVDLARRQLRAATNGQSPRRADIDETVGRVHREWSGRLWTALEALGA